MSILVLLWFLYKRKAHKNILSFHIKAVGTIVDFYSIGRMANAPVLEVTDEHGEKFLIKATGKSSKVYRIGDRMNVYYPSNAPSEGTTEEAILIAYNISRFLLPFLFLLCSIIAYFSL